MLCAKRRGPKGDCQAETYRRMKKATRGDWRHHAPATNVLWMHYLADICLTQKLTFPCRCGGARGVELVLGGEGRGEGGGRRVRVTARVPSSCHPCAIINRTYAWVPTPPTHPT